ncbi:MAG: hypothetical protein K8E24_015840, partial [Methanobacterium paludis]|nr:hypothetical protein [Methanobacterium paludis]
LPQKNAKNIPNGTPIHRISSKNLLTLTCIFNPRFKDVNHLKGSNINATSFINFYLWNYLRFY